MQISPDADTKPTFPWFHALGAIAPRQRCSNMSSPHSGQGYLFVHHDSRDSWRPIYETPAVRSVLKHGNQIQWVNAGAVEAVQAAQAVQAFAATQPSETSPWRPGDAVAPRVGPLMGLPGVVLATNGENATVGILFLGQLREVVYPSDALVSRDDF